MVRRFLSQMFTGLKISAGHGFLWGFFHTVFCEKVNSHQSATLKFSTLIKTFIFRVLSLVSEHLIYLCIMGRSIITSRRKPWWPGDPFGEN